MLKKLYNVWCVFTIVTIFLLLWPFLYVCLVYKPWNKYGLKITNLWADIWFPIIGKPVKIEHRFKPLPTEQYMFVANHFSYLDVAVGMKVVRNYFSFMGKAEVKNIPLLGYMFTKLHIQVNRSDRNSRAKSIEQSNYALKHGRSLFIMPEGGIISSNIPKMHQPFKDGAFALAIDNQVPIVPITFTNLYKIMPHKSLNWGKPLVVFHEKIETKGLTKADIESLKIKVYAVIQAELDARA